MAKLQLRTGAVEAALADMSTEFNTTELAAHPDVLQAHFQKEPDRDMNTRVGDWLSHEGYRFRVFKHPAHPVGKNDQLWQWQPAAEK